MKKMKNKNNKNRNRAVVLVDEDEFVEANENEQAIADDEVTVNENTEAGANEEEASKPIEEVTETIVDKKAVSMPEEAADDSSLDDELQELSDDYAEDYELYDESENQDESVKKVNRKANAKEGERFTDFLIEFWHHIRKIIEDNKLAFKILVTSIVVIVIVLVIVNAVTKKSNMPTAISGNNAEDVSANDILDVPDDELLLDAYPEVNELINTYFNAMETDDISTITSIRNITDEVETARFEVKSNYIESYENIACYSKPGPYENSYIVYVSYDVKFVGYDCLAPSLLTVVVCTGNDGNMYLYSGKFDENIAKYIMTISSQDDVRDLIHKVGVKYQEVLDENPEFAEYMATLNEVIKNDVSIKLAAENYDETNETVSGDNVSENEVSSNEISNESEKTFDVKANTTVNVRKSDSENADKLGKVTEGTVLTCNEAKVNGWSQVVYEGEIGYIKTEFLDKVENGDTENLSVTTGSVTVKETVNIRKSADTNSEQVGVAYKGNSFSLVEHLDNGWSKIIYEGKEAYIKTEFLE